MTPDYAPTDSVAKNSDTALLRRYQKKLDARLAQAKATGARNRVIGAFKGVGDDTLDRFMRHRRASGLTADEFLSRLLSLAQKAGKL